MEDVEQVGKDIEKKVLLTNELEERRIKEHLAKGRSIGKEYRKRLQEKSAGEEYRIRLKKVVDGEKRNR